MVPPDLDFRVESVAPVPFGATPLLGFRIAVTNGKPEQAIYSVALRAQIQIEVTRRPYSAEDQERLRDLFDAPERWGQTLRNMLWTNAVTTVASFNGSTTVEMQVPCTFDFNIAATKYFHGIESGEIPLCFLFSGTVFYDGGDGTPLVAPISWSKEARCRLPAGTWREMMATYYPNIAWLCLRRDVFERLHQYKIRKGIPTWEAVLERMLSACEEAVVS
jgi:hypothetical protein